MQENVAFCGIAGLASIANDLELPAAEKIKGERAAAGERAPRLHQQDIIELVRQGRPHTDEGVPIIADDIKFPRGAFLPELNAIVEMMGATTEICHVAPEDRANEVGLQEFRAAAIAAIESESSHVLIQYNRPDADQQGGGHFSPLAAYHQESDSFLLFDTAAFKVEPAWIPARKLYEAMATFDADAGKSRGYLTVTNPS